MPRTTRPMPAFRHTVRRAGRSISFQRPDLPERPPPPHLSSSRSFPNLAKLAEKASADPCADELTHPNLPFQPSISSSSTTTTDVSQGAPQVPSSPQPTQANAKPFLRRIGSSRSLRRLSLGHRRTSSFAEPHSRAWSGGFSSGGLSTRGTDDFLGGWSMREGRMRKKRCASYSCSDFEVAEETLVEIGKRLPDRTDGVREDVFGRRRGGGGEVLEMAKRGVLACEVDEEETMRNIAMAIDSSKGRLRRSANMSKAFRAVIKSGEGLVRKSELIRATLNSEESKDPSMIILLDPDSCDTGGQEGVSSTSEESGSVETVASSSGESSCASVGFSTSMTAKQCAATLETMLREMACKVSRYPDGEQGIRAVVRLKVTRIPPGGKKMDRKIKIMITIREEDHIRTSVSFKRVAGLYTSRDSHIPLCTDIRDRFQREWPAVVEALYIRIPNVHKRQLDL